MDPELLLSDESGMGQVKAWVFWAAVTMYILNVQCGVLTGIMHMGQSPGDGVPGESLPSPGTTMPHQMSLKQSNIGAMFWFSATASVVSSACAQLSW